MSSGVSLPFGLALTRRQGATWHAVDSRPSNSSNCNRSPARGAKWSPAAPSARTAPASMSISTPWSKSRRPPPPASPKAPCNPCSNSSRPPSGPNSPVPTAADSVPSAASPGPSRPEGPTPRKTSRFATVPTAAGTFSPRRPILRLDGHGYSPAVLRMIVTAGTRLHSFADAAFAVGLCGVPISARHVQQLTEEVGADLARARAAQAEMRRRRTLTPRVASTPPAVVVEVDGGRVRTRATGCGPGVHEAEGKEDKIACLATLTEVATGEDPCPEPPPSFVEPRRIQRLVQQMSQKSGEAVTPGATSDEAFSPEAATPGAEPWSPRRRGRTCVASLTDSRSLGPLVAAEAQSRDFFAAPRRAFVADGQAYNWTIH